MKGRFSRKKVARSTALSAFVLLIAGSVIVANHFDVSAASQTLVVNASDLQKPLADCIVEGYGNEYGLKPHTGNTLSVSVQGEGEEEQISITYSDTDNYYLDCSAKDLVSVASINQLSDIDFFWVDLSDNPNLVDISGLSSFGNIDTINLSNTGIEYDSNTLDALSTHNLQRLYLEHANVDNEAITALGNHLGGTLKTLILDNNGLTNVSGFDPTYYDHRFSVLEALGLSNNNLNDISGLNRLARLEYLYVDGNSNLKSLAVIKELASLEYIDATDCFVEDISDTLNTRNGEYVNNTTVKTFILDENALPKSQLRYFAYYTALERLDIRSQDAEDYGTLWANELAPIAQVNTLDMSDLGIVYIRTEWLPNLREIDLSNNQLTTALSLYSDNQNLVKVKVSNNGIFDFGEFFDNYQESYALHGNQTVYKISDTREDIDLPAAVAQLKDAFEITYPNCTDCTVSETNGNRVSMNDGKTEATYVLFADEQGEKPLVTVNITAPEGERSNKYLVNYSFNGGESDIHPNGIQEIGDLLEVNKVKYGAETVGREGYTFLGWALHNNSTAARYEKDDTIRFADFRLSQSDINGDIYSVSLYAIWEENPVTEPTTTNYYIGYNVNGGDYDPRVNPGGNYYFSSTNLSDLQTVKGIIPTRGGYSFKGWSARRNASTATFEAGDIITSDYFAANNNRLTLYAVWWEDVNSSTQSDTCNLYVYHYKKGTTEEIADGISTRHYCNNIQTVISLDPSLLSRGYTFDSATLRKGNAGEALTESSFPLRLVNSDDPTILTIYYNEPEANPSTQSDSCSVSVYHYKEGTTEELDSSNAPSLTRYCGSFQSPIDLSDKALNELGLVFDSATLRINDKVYNLDESQFPFMISNSADSVELTILYKEPSSSDPNNGGSSNSSSPSSSSDADSSTANANTGDKIAKIAFPGIGIIAIAGFALVKMIRRR